MTRRRATNVLRVVIGHILEEAQQHRAFRITEVAANTAIRTIDADLVSGYVPEGARHLILNLVHVGCLQKRTAQRYVVDPRRLSFLKELIRSRSEEATIRLQLFALPSEKFVQALAESSNESLGDLNQEIDPEEGLDEDPFSVESLFDENLENDEVLGIFYKGTK